MAAMYMENELPLCRSVSSMFYRHMNNVYILKSIYFQRYTRKQKNVSNYMYFYILLVVVYF